MIDRLSLTQILNGIPQEQLLQIIFTLDPPKGIIPLNTSQGQQVFALLQWAESPSGCGLGRVQTVLDKIIRPPADIQTRRWLLKCGVGVGVLIVLGVSAGAISEVVLRNKDKVNQVTSSLSPSGAFIEAKPDKPQSIPEWGEIIDPEGDCIFSVDGSKLKVSIPGKEHILDAELPKMNAPRVLQDVTGDFVVQVKVAGTFPPGESSLVPDERLPFQGAGLLLWQDAKNYIRLERAQRVSNGQTISYVSWELRRNGQIYNSEYLDYSSKEEQLWLKLERQGDKISAFVSLDSVQWSSLKPIIFNFSKTVSVGIIAGHNTPTPLTVEFEGFKLKR